MGNGYLEKRAYVEFYANMLGRQLAKLANMSIPHAVTEMPAKGVWNTRRALGGAIEEFGPAAGATLGAGIATGYGHSPLAGAALGYGIGSIPELVAGSKIKSLLKLPLH